MVIDRTAVEAGRVVRCTSYGNEFLLKLGLLTDWRLRAIRQTAMDSVAFNAL